MKVIWEEIENPFAMPSCCGNCKDFFTYKKDKNKLNKFVKEKDHEEYAKTRDRAKSEAIKF